MVTEEEPSDMELASELIPVPQVPAEVEQEEVVEQNKGRNQVDEIPRVRKSRIRKKTLHAAIRKQMEFYFSDANLARDRFLGKLIKENPYVDIETFLHFNKIQALTDDTNRIAKALQESTILQVSEDGTKVCRITPITVKENSDECTIYVQRLPRDADHDMLNSIFSQYGSIAYISIPKYKLTHNVKGFAFIEFDKPEDAAKCLQAFREKGYELPSETSPSHVMSITTYNENENMEESLSGENNSEERSNEKMEVKDDDGKTEENEDKVKSKSIKKANKRTATDTLDAKADDEEIQSKKRKERKSEEKEEKLEEESKEEKEDNDAVEKAEVLKKTNKKRKKSAEDFPKKDSFIESPKKNKKKRKAPNESDSETKDTEVPKKALLEEKSEKKDTHTDTIKEKKKKNRHKVYRTFEKADATDLGLQVMSKKDWKKLRNRYLDLQRQKMHQLKQHLFKTRRNQWNNLEKPKSEKEETEDVKSVTKQDGIRDFTYTTGLIVKVQLDQPCVDVQTFKKEFKGNSSVKYVDITEGAVIAYVRYDTADAAKEAAQKSTAERNMTIITGDEEKWYWDKMKSDREEKLSKRGKVNQRGRNKLLKRAEKELGKHIKFDEV